VYIRNIEWNVHENLLLKFLGRFGAVKRCSILRDEFTHKSRGLGYAEFVADADCERLLAARPEELVLNGRELAVCPYKEKTDKQKVSKRKCAQERARRNTETRCSGSDTQASSMGTTTTATTTIAAGGQEDGAGGDGSQLVAKDLMVVDDGNGGVGSVAGDLPYNLLMLVFSGLSIRDLCMAEQGFNDFFSILTIFNGSMVNSNKRK
jgi:RNA recognition motif-containing protein